MKAELQEIASQFALEGAITAIDSLGEGFINDTFIVRTEGDAPDYILQRKNKNIFPDVPAMMENIRKVTDHIRRRVAAVNRNCLILLIKLIPVIIHDRCNTGRCPEFSLIYQRRVSACHLHRRHTVSKTTECG